MRRLSIIDLQSGHQPISNEDRTVWIVYNGEIYNHADLRTQLASKGHVIERTATPRQLFTFTRNMARIEFNTYAAVRLCPVGSAKTNPFRSPRPARH